MNRREALKRTIESVPQIAKRVHEDTKRQLEDLDYTVARDLAGETYSPVRLALGGIAALCIGGNRVAIRLSPLYVGPRDVFRTYRTYSRPE